MSTIQPRRPEKKEKKLCNVDPKILIKILINYPPKKKIGVYRRTKMRGQLGDNKGVTNCGERKWGELPNPTN